MVALLLPNSTIEIPEEKLDAIYGSGRYVMLLSDWALMKSTALDWRYGEPNIHDTGKGWLFIAAGLEGAFKECLDVIRGYILSQGIEPPIPKTETPTARHPWILPTFVIGGLAIGALVLYGIIRRDK